MPATTAIGVASTPEVRSGRRPRSLSGPSRMPSSPRMIFQLMRPQQEAGEERGDDEEQEQVLVAAAAERDRVGERVGDQERQERRRGRRRRSSARTAARSASSASGVVGPVVEREREARSRATRSRSEADEHLDARVRRRTRAARAGPGPAGGTGRSAGCGAVAPTGDASAVRAGPVGPPVAGQAFENLSLKYVSSSSVRALKMWTLASDVVGREDQRVLGELRIGSSPRGPPRRP